MFIIEITYKKSLEHVDKHLSAHREFLDEAYIKNYFVASGPKMPRTGGIMISHLTDRNLLEDLLNNDPFKVNDVADYKIIEFTPTKYHSNFATFVHIGVT